MLKELQVTSFRTLKSIKCAFGRVTVLVGPSGVGKSNLCRAIAQLLYNGGGNDFITEGDASTQVRLVFDEGEVEYYKGTGRVPVNRYTLKTSAGEQVFDKVGLDVPEVVAKFLQVKSYKIDETFSIEPNYASQFSPTFLLFDSPVRVAQVFGTVANLKALFIPVRNCSKDIRRETVDLNVRLTKSMDQLNAKLISFVGIDELSQKVEEIKSLVSVLQQTQEALVLAKEYSEVVAKAYRAKDYCLTYSTLGIDYTAGLLYARNIEYEELCGIRDSYANINPRIAASCRAMEVLEGFDKVSSFRRYGEEIDELKSIRDEGLILSRRFNSLRLYGGLDLLVENTLSAYKETSSIRDQVRELANKKMEWIGVVEQTSRSQVSLEAAYAAALKEMKVCPVCKQRVGV